MMSFVCDRLNMKTLCFVLLAAFIVHRKEFPIEINEWRGSKWLKLEWLKLLTWEFVAAAEIGRTSQWKQLKNYFWINWTKHFKGKGRKLVIMKQPTENTFARISLVQQNIWPQHGFAFFNIIIEFLSCHHFLFCQPA